MSRKILKACRSIYKIPADFVLTQLDTVLTDLTVQAIKIGMLDDERIIEAISKVIEKYNLKNIVLDPVMVAKDGSRLLDPNALSILKQKLFYSVDLITPNLVEAECILERNIRTEQEAELAAIEIDSTLTLMY